MDRQRSAKTEKTVSPVSTVLLLALLLAVGRLFILDVVRGEGHSMEPTLRSSQMLQINRLSYGIILPFSDRYLLMWNRPNIGDVVVLRNRINGRTLIKRCFAREGDPITYRDGCLYIGSQIIETFPIYLSEFRAVPKGHIMVLGDNRSFSVDSRAFGFVDVERVMGRALVDRRFPHEQSRGEEEID